jgi:hypothetical protein
MSKTPKQEIEDKIEALQLQLIEVNAQIEALTPLTLPDYMGDNRERDQKRREHEAKREGIISQIAFLTAKIAQIPPSSGRKQKPKMTKQANVYSEILKLKKRNSKLTNEEAFEKLANRLGDSEEAIRKAFYAEQRRLNDKSNQLARGNRDSERDSDQQGQAEK